MTWKEGKHIDVWSITHFLSGVVFTGWALEVGMDLVSAFIAYLAIAILWEAFEVYREIQEHHRNRVVDVLVGIVGFFLVAMILDESGHMNLIWLIISSIAYLGLGLYGYSNYRKRMAKQEVSEL